jgi:23S rRNA (cytosine1962-C5)-methyltransferase
MDKTDMFRNRLVKVYKHRSKLAKRQQVSCYRVYDHDLTEFPLCIELYEDKIYLAEYLRRHGMEDEEHDAWLRTMYRSDCEVTGVAPELIYVRQRKRMSHREDQYEKMDTKQEFFTVLEKATNSLLT